MNTVKCDLGLVGPLNWTGDPRHSFLFESPNADAAGVYLWTVQTPEGELVYYVGQTGTSFAERQWQWLTGYLAGQYRVYDPEAFAEGRRGDLVWGGMWRKSERDRAVEFLQRYEELAPIIREFVGLLRIWLLPLEYEPRIRKRIEGAIARHLRSQEDPVGSFQDTDIHYPRRREDEEPIAVQISYAANILGMQDVVRL